MLPERIITKRCVDYNIQIKMATTLRKDIQVNTNSNTYNHSSLNFKKQTTIH